MLSTYIHMQCTEDIYIYIYIKVHFFLVANQTKGGKIQAASTLNRTSHRTSQMWTGTSQRRVNTSDAATRWRDHDSVCENSMRALRKRRVEIAPWLHNLLPRPLSFLACGHARTLLATGSESREASILQRVARAATTICVVQRALCN